MTVAGADVVIACRVGALCPPELKAVTAYSTVVPSGELESVKVVTFVPTVDIFVKSPGNVGDDFDDRKMLKPSSDVELSTQLSSTLAM
jgi:hypothetical protein